LFDLDKKLRYLDAADWVDAWVWLRNAVVVLRPARWLLVLFRYFGVIDELDLRSFDWTSSEYKM
jgi:hypothetical protein